MAWPEGVTHMWDLPWNFISAFQQASMIIGWQESLSQEEMPPKQIWRDNDKLNEHFKNLRKKWSGKETDELDAPMGTFEDAKSGQRVQVRNRIGDYVRESMSDQWDDFTDF